MKQNQPVRFIQLCNQKPEEGKHVSEYMDDDSINFIFFIDKTRHPDFVIKYSDWCDSGWCLGKWEIK